MEYSNKVRNFLKKHGMEPERLPLAQAVTDFVEEMQRGLAGESCSMDMIPTYLSPGVPPAGSSAAVIDAGGTNFRASHVSFTERGAVIDRVERASMPGSVKSATWDEFVEFSAERLLPMLDDASAIGFCFSYRAEITPDRDGRVILMSKGVDLTGYEGRYVCADLKAALRRRGVREMPAVLVNDTAAVALSGASLLRTEGYDSLAGLVVGTGQNSCCALDPARIGKLGVSGGRPMFVNLESGCYSLCPSGDYDLELDAASDNPGDHLFEKMTSGAYLGELCLLTLRGAARDGLLGPTTAGRFLTANSLTSAEAGKYALEAPKFFRSRDGLVVRDICHAVFSRAARLVCANLTAILVLTDRGTDPEHPACICADGSVIRLNRVFSSELSRYMDSFTRAIMGRHSVIHTIDEATTLGSAAAALLNG